MAHDSAAPDRNQRPPHPGSPGAAASRSAPSSALSCGERHAKAKQVPDDTFAAMGAAPPLLGASALLGNPCHEPDPAARYPIGNIVRLSEITPDPIHWLSPGRLAFGKITVLDGDPRPSKTLQDEAAAHGHAVPVLARARHAESIVIRKQPGPNGHWTWELPAPRAAAHPEHG